MHARLNAQNAIEMVHDYKHESCYLAISSDCINYYCTNKQMQVESKAWECK